MPRASVIICTYNREEALCDLLGDLLTQTFPDFEIIVVDQTTTHAPVTAAFLADHRDRVRHLRVSTPNLPGARNIGAAAAAGDVLVFMDDDLRVGASFVGDVTEQFDDSATDAVAPRVMPEPYEPGWEPPRSRLRRRAGPGGRRPLRSCIGACYAVRRYAWEAIGGADPVMGRINGHAAAGEDYEVTRRLTGAGYRLQYVPALTVRHIGGMPGGCENRIGPHAHDLTLHARANAYVILKEEGAFEHLTPKAMLRLARLTALRRDVISAGPGAVLNGLGRIGTLVEAVRAFVRSDRAAPSGRALEQLGDGPPL